MGGMNVCSLSGLLCVSSVDAMFTVGPYQSILTLTYGYC